VQVWSAERGREHAACEALGAGSVAGALRSAPADQDELVAQVRREHAVERRNLEVVTESFYERDWRREHRGDGTYPADYLWWAAAGYLDLDNALRRLEA
jgi:hypothetical protein